MRASKRKRMIIDPSLQGALARKIALHWGAFFVLVLAVGSFLQMMFAVSFEGFLPSLFKALQQQLSVVLLMAILLPIFVRDTLKLGHQFAGPMFRIRRSLAALGEGVDVPPVKLRRGDFWQETAIHLNAVRERMASLELRKTELEQENRQLRQSLSPSQQEPARQSQLLSEV